MVHNDIIEIARSRGLQYGKYFYISKLLLVRRKHVVSGGKFLGSALGWASTAKNATCGAAFEW
jgi:hypothetical protein